MQHFKFGSSSAARTDACQGWVSQSEGIPRQESSFAIHGSMIHQILEDRGLDDDYDIKAQLGAVNTEFDLPYEQDHIDMALEMWAATEKVMADYGVIEYEAETTGTAGEDIGGTLDMIANCGDKALLIDYKTGMGVAVSPVNNKQLLFATAVCEIESGAADMLAPHDNFVGIILQPNRAGEVEIKTWEFTRELVDQFWDNHIANIALAREGSTEPVAGDNCKFCPANGLCDATNGNLLRMQQLDPEDIEQLAEGLDLIEQVKATISNLEKLAYQQLEVGMAVPGWKLVEGKLGNTAWDDPLTALKKIKRMVRGLKEADGTRVATMMEVKKMITPTQAKKLLKKHAIALEWMDEITSRPPAKGNTLAKESDKRPAVLSSAGFAAAINSIM
jgi:hypothetical protein